MEQWIFDRRHVFEISSQAGARFGEFGCGIQFRRRSHLFVPLNKPHFLDKVARGDVRADGIIWDLEDSVPADAKAYARDQLLKLPRRAHNVEYIVRINGCSFEERAKDISALCALPKDRFDTVTIPKGESAQQVGEIIASVGRDKRYIVTIESLAGLNAVEDIASALCGDVDALGFGVGDMSADFVVPRQSAAVNPLFQYAMSKIVCAARRCRLDVFDSVCAELDNLDSLANECRVARTMFGCTGKKCITPRHVTIINEHFAPTLADVRAAVLTVENFLTERGTNAHNVAGHYEGVPALRTALGHIQSWVRQGYLEPAARVSASMTETSEPASLHEQTQ